MPTPSFFEQERANLPSQQKPRPDDLSLTYEEKIPQGEEEKRPNGIYLKYTYTPETLPKTTNLCFDQAKKEGWFITIADSSRGQIRKDLNRGLLINGDNYRNKPEAEQWRAISEFVGSDLNLYQHYNQSLLSFPVTIFTAGVFQNQISFLPSRRKENLFRLGYEVFFRTEHDHFTYVDPMQRESKTYFIPGRIEVAYKWDPDRGFRITELGFSNQFLRDLSLNNRKERLQNNEELLTEEEAFLGIKAAYQEELEGLLAKNNVEERERNILLEIKRLYEQSIDIEDVRTSEILFRAYQLTRARIEQPENNNDQAYAKLLFEAALHCPELKRLLELMELGIPFGVQYNSAQYNLVNTLISYNSSNKENLNLSLMHGLGINLYSRVHELSQQYPQDKALLMEVLWQTEAVLDAARSCDVPRFQQCLVDYSNLSKKIAKPAWGRIIGGAMLALTFTAIVGFCCATAVGVLALPFLAAAASATCTYLVPTAAGVVGAASSFGIAGGLGIFGKGVAKGYRGYRLGREMDELAQRASEHVRHKSSF